MTALTGDAALFVAIAAAAGWSEWRSRASLRAIQNEFGKLYALLTALDARIALLEHKPNGAGNFDPRIKSPGASVSARNAGS